MKSPVVVGVGAAIAVAALLTIVASKALPAPHAPVVSEPLLSLPSTNSIEKVATTTTASTVAAATSTKKDAGAAAAPAGASPAPAPVVPPAKPIATQAQLNAAAARLSSAIVNILCSPKEDSDTLHAISGSGVIIDPKGIILTDAHIGQFFLLEHGVPNQDAYECIIRTGSPAEVAYEADAVYVSSAWIQDNPSVIIEDQPLGTGEHDIALLAIDGSATRAPLPSSFPYVPLAQDAPDTGDQVIIGSYAAQFLDASNIRSDLTSTIVYTTVKDIFTFYQDTVDIVSLGGSVAAQEGSSGGGVVNPNAQLVALVTTSTVEGDLTKRELNAITAPYIRRVIAADTGSDVDSYLSQSVTSLVSEYSHLAGYLANILVEQINQ